MTVSATIRTWCLFLISICLTILMMMSYMDLYKSRVCDNYYNDRLRSLNFEKHNGDCANASSLKPWDFNWDLKQSKNESIKVRDRNFILVRHGQYDHKTGKLTERGRKQSNLTGLRIKEMNFPYKRIVSSTLERALETAQIIHSLIPGVNLEKDEILKEGGPMPPNPKINYWRLPPRNYHVDGPRLEAAFRKYLYRADSDTPSTSYEILVAHGNIFRYFVLRALQFQADGWMRVFLAHASITFLIIKGDGTVAMLLYGDVGHLPYNDVTY